MSLGLPFPNLLCQKSTVSRLVKSFHDKLFTGLQHTREKTECVHPLTWWVIPTFNITLFFSLFLCNYFLINLTRVRKQLLTPWLPSIWSTMAWSCCVPKCKPASTWLPLAAYHPTVSISYTALLQHAATLCTPWLTYQHTSSFGTFRIQIYTRRQTVLTEQPWGFPQ